MTQYNSLAPAASASAVAGGGQFDLTVELGDLNAAVLTFTTAASRVAQTPVSDMYSVLLEANVAAQAVADAAADVQSAASALLGAAPAPAPAAAAPAAPAPAAPLVGSLIRNSGPWIAGQIFNVVPPQPLAAIPDNGERWYAITRGKYVGLTKSSAVSINAVSGVPGSLTEKLSNQSDAIALFNQALAQNVVAVIH
ncbi:hypothetical protein B0H11DRAFT_2262785 [Mycena galericulata]|nr:hypothetical protein B0H11DRAFT_2262785 [Mycena galericulata]